VRIRFAVAELGEGMAPSDLTELAGLALAGAKLEREYERETPSPGLA
jgi:hypothetical protein